MDDELLESEPQKERQLHWIFIGREGVRAGWSVLLYALLAVVFAAGMGWAVHHFVPHPPASNAPMTPRGGAVGEGLQALAVLAATAIMARAEGRPVLSYGYLGRAKLVRFAGGLLCGFAAVSALVGALWKARLLVVDGRMLSGAVAIRYGLEWAGVFLLVALFEESLLRGYLQFTVARGIGFWWSALLLSVAFGSIHGSNPGESPVGLFSAGAIGLIFCLSLWYTGSLWWALGFHAAWDWGESYFYGTSDSGLAVKGHLLATHPAGGLLWSGGLTGPEGSLLVVPLLLAMTLLMWLWWGRRGAEFPAMEADRRARRGVS